MTLTRALSFALAIAASALPAKAQQPPHHPAGAAKTPSSMAAKSKTEMADMDAKMKVMHQMHDKMMAAKTPEERQALMAEHMKSMQDGMSMMNGMSGGNMGSMGGMKGDAATRMQMMEKRMDMMQSMMTMMMDRMPPSPPK
ncbi:hypothetical protein [Gemmatimonas sp.]|uniref:hypothetical protein n=1 Tax=Gemmatimonas sp. TaxID=1962908 RepID=UPI0039835434